MAEVLKQWDRADYVCVVNVNPLGFRCGYVGVRPDHPLHGKDYCTFWDLGERYHFNVHGGLTFSSDSNEDYPVKLDRQWSKNHVWWFGFDCGHSGDAPETELMNEVAKACHEKYMSTIYEGAVVRSTEYVVNECEELVVQFEKFRGDENADTV